MTRRYFGTDGIRGRVGEPPITADFVLKLGWAAGRVLARSGRGKVLIGKDTRISGYMFESALESGLSAAGIDICLLGPMPTPAVAYLSRTLHVQAGIVISASHNPYYDNGIKFFAADGTKLSDELELAIEAELDKPMRTVDSAHLGKAERLHAEGRYIEFCKSTVPYSINLKGLRIVVDCAHGATYKVAPSVFSELGAEIFELGVEPDGLNINEGCGSTHVAALQKGVPAHRADLGIAFDGDGDRVIMVDRNGEVVDGDELLFIIAESRRRQGALNGAVVGTVMSNLGLELALREGGVDFCRVPVGDRHVMQALLDGGGTLGGEGSGHIICLDRTITGDGIIAALQVLAEMVQTGRSLHELKAGMTKHPQVLINVRVKGKADLTSAPAVQNAVRAAETRLAGMGRVLLRSSGTEPVVRVMVEGAMRPLVEDIAKELADVVAASFGAERAAL